ncbi:MAG: right-handed parallel beta-helix repeat-containing protein [Nocardiaceae bacterium]|nr:right-handed parallel beta-helix repeat-containing protein [Nocardiaceae bacterium]
MSIDTVNDLPPRAQYVALAAQTVFPYPFPIFDDADLDVYVDGVLKTLFTQYTVSGEGDDAGGNVTLATPLVGGEIVTIVRNIAIERDTDISQNGPWSSQAYNDELDKVILILQELKADFRRSLRISTLAEVDDVDLELSVSAFANMYLSFNADGKPVPAVLSATTMTQAILGQLLYPTSNAETTAAVVITQFYRPYGHIKRYGAAVDGVTDDRAAIMHAYNQFKVAGGAIPILPEGTSFVSQNGATGYALQLDGDVILDGKGKFGLIGSAGTAYTLIYANTGTNVNIDVRGIDFNGAKTVTVSESSNDIGFRVGSSVNTIRFSGNTLRNFKCDGFYFGAAVNGAGGTIEDNTFSNIGRDGVTVVQGRWLKILNNRFFTNLLQPVTVIPPNNSTMCRDIHVIGNRIVGGGTDTFSTTDRFGIFMSHKTGATSTNMGGFVCADNTIEDFAVGYVGPAPLRGGIEIRECKGAIVKGNNVRGCTGGPGLYAYLCDAISITGNLALSNDKGLWTNACTRVSESANICLDNVTANFDHNGPDGDSTFSRSDSQCTILARGSVSISAGTPALNAGFNVTIDADVGTGDTRFTLTVPAGDADYSVIPAFRSGPAAGTIQSSNHTTSQFRIQTFAGGSPADHNYDFIVVGIPTGTVEPV